MFDEAVQLYDCHTRTFRDTVLTTAVQQTWVSTLLRGHGVNHRLDRFERIVTHFHTLQRFVHTRYHTHQVLHRTHLLDLRQLTHEVIEIKLILRDLLTDPTGFLLVVLFLRALHEADHVTHTEDTIGHTRGMKDIQRLHLLARTDILNRFVNDRTNRKRCTSTCITVQFGQYHTIEIETVIELLGGIHRILTGHGIYHKQGLRGFYRSLDRRNLLHHLLIDCQTTRRIHDHHVIPVRPCFFDRVLRDLHRITTIKRLGRVTIKQSTISEYLRPDLFTQYTQLLDSRRTIYIARYQHHFLALLRLQEVRQFGCEGGLTRTLQTGHQDHRRITLQVNLLCLTSHQCR